MAKILAPHNVRKRVPRLCGHCHFLTYPGDGTSMCSRPAGPQWDSGDGEEWRHVCDRFKRYNRLTAKRPRE